MNARDDILARIARAVPASSSTPPPEARPAHAYRTAGSLTLDARLSLFEERIREYGVQLARSSEETLQEAVEGALKARGARRILVPAGFPPAWLPSGLDAVADDPGSSSSEQLAALDGVVTTCAVAIAETGTLALDTGPGQGRRALTLVPDYHLCVVLAGQVVQTVPEAVRRLEPSVASGQPITLVSGPSATSDIELNRVAGVHGPRTLDVILVT